MVTLFSLSPSGLLHFGPERLQCDGVERKTGLQGGAEGGAEQSSRKYTEDTLTYNAGSL